MSHKIIQYFKSIGINEFKVMFALYNIEDSEDWPWIRLYNRVIPITKNEFIHKRWNDFCAYVNNHKELYYKYFSNDKSKIDLR
jgi:hypothetical protein